VYGKATAEDVRRYSSAECIGCETQRIQGDPDPKHVSTSYIERQNLTMRMCVRRFTRLTNGFSKKVENHVYSVAIHYMHYNFCKVHQTLRVTPAMESGLPITCGLSKKCLIKSACKIAKARFAAV